MRERLAVPVTAAVVTVLVLAPLAAPGYVLAYDMVFTPRQPLRWELIFPAATLPRAVPQDALVSLVSQAVPGWLVQRLVLAAVLLLAACGAGRLVPTGRSGVRVVAAVAYAWTPYLAERLLIGQWGLLLAYAALPWLARAALDRREGRVVLWAALCAITPTGGLIGLATAAVLAPRWRPVLGAAAVNLPWLLAAALTSADGRSDPAGVAAFAARGADWSGPFGALLSTGGIWNAQTTLPSRGSALTPVGTVLVLGVAVAGWALLRSRMPAATRLLWLAAGGFVIALAGVTPLADDLLGWLVAHVPGAGVLRDGQKFLIPYALLLALGFAVGAERLAVRKGVLAAAALLPLALQPDLALGGLGRLRPVGYPADFAVVARAVERDPGPVLSLPFAAYHSYPWNRGRTVLDPLPRYLDADVWTDDRLVVGTLVVAGEDTRAARVRAVIDNGGRLTDLGVRWVVVQRVVGTPAPPPTSLRGLTLVHDGIDLDLYRTDTVRVSYQVVTCPPRTPR